MARKRDWLNFWCPIGIGILVCGAALRWPDLGAELIALGVAIIVASIVHYWLRFSPSILMGGVVGILVLGCLLSVDRIFPRNRNNVLPNANFTASPSTATSEPSNVGKLESPGDETILAPKLGVSKRLIQIGQSGTYIDFQGSQGTPFIQFASNYNLTIDSVDGKLEVSTQVRDRRGRLVAELVQNEWKVAPPPRTWDRNYTSTALEVRDEDGNVVLQVRLFPDRVQIQGEWWMDEYRGFRIVGYPGEGGRFEIFGTKFRPSDADPIQQMFVYPSETHLGELAATNPSAAPGQ
jgi:hypothetical protein